MIPSRLFSSTSTIFPFGLIAWYLIASFFGGIPSFPVFDIPMISTASPVVFSWAMITFPASDLLLWFCTCCAPYDIGPIAPPNIAPPAAAFTALSVISCHVARSFFSLYSHELNSLPSSANASVGPSVNAPSTTDRETFLTNCLRELLVLANSSKSAAPLFDITSVFPKINLPILPLKPFGMNLATGMASEPASAAMVKSIVPNLSLGFTLFFSILFARSGLNDLNFSKSTVPSSFNVLGYNPCTVSFNDWVFSAM